VPEHRDGAPCYPERVVQPLVKGALAVAVLAAASALAPAAIRGRTGAPREAASTDGDLMKMPCGSREIPEGEACVPVPALSASGDDPGTDAQPPDDAGPTRLPRRPDRPAAIQALSLPIAGEPPLLDLPGGAADDDDRSVILLGAPRGTPAHAVALEGQEGPFEVLGIERLSGRGLVVGVLATIGSKGAKDATRARQARSAAKAPRKDAESFLVLFGSLDGAGPGLERGGKLIDGAIVGFAGEARPGGAPGLRFEARRLRPGTDAHLTPLAKLVTDAESVATDARNVLPARVKERDAGPD